MDDKGKCVLTGRWVPQSDAREDVSWCGKFAHSKVNWCFNDAGHLALSGINGISSVKVCPDCVSAIETALRNCL